MVLNAVVLTWFAFFALGLSAFIGNQIFLAINSGGGFLGGTFNVLGEATRYCVLMVLMAIICFQAPSLASALTGGASIQQGIQMIQNAMMVSGLRSSSRGASAASGAGGVIRSGAGLAHTAGAAAGTAGRSASATARRGYGAARSAAYKLAAMRGRT
jgi:type IV secretion system protein VirB6